MSEKNIYFGPADGSETEDSGAWRLDAELGLLRDSAGVERRLEPRLARLMSLLLINTGKFVSRRALIDEMWPDSVVTEQSLTRAVADLRKFLRSGYRAPPVIETASKQGYRLSFPAEKEVPGQSPNRLRWNVLRVGTYGLGALVLLVLAVRGLHY